LKLDIEKCGSGCQNKNASLIQKIKGPQSELYKKRQQSTTHLDQDARKKTLQH
jgi:hypothetical protein